MAKLSQVAASVYTNVMVFGGPKTGKTELVGKLAEHFDLVWVDMEHGYETLLKLPKSWLERIELIRLPDTRSYPIAIETVLKMVKGKVTICDKHGKCSCMICKKEGAPVVEVDLKNLGPGKIVVFDSATQLTNSAIANITKKEDDDYKLNYDDWGNLGKLLDIFYSHLQQCEYNSVVISHEQETETEGKKNVLTPVSGTRNYSRNVAKYFSHVVYCERKNKKHTFGSSTSYATNILTGSRTDFSIEDNGDGSLLPIFLHPESVPATVLPSASSDNASKPETTGGASSGVTVTSKPPKTESSTSDILAKLKARSSGAGKNSSPSKEGNTE